MLALLLAVAVEHFGRRQFGAGDYGSFVSHAWAMHLGFAPYREILTPYPPLFLLGARAAFGLFGVRFQSLIHVAAIFAALALAAQAALLRRLGIARGWALAIPLSIGVSGVLPLSVWAYNPETAIVAALFLTATALLHAEPASRRARAAFALTAAVVMLAKPNVAGPVLLATGVAFLATRGAVALALLGAAAFADLALLGLLRFDLGGLAQAYLAAAGQRSAPGHFTRFLFWNESRFEAPDTLAALAPILVCAVAWLPSLRRRKNGFDFVLALAGAGGTLAAWATNHEFRMSDCAPLLAGAAVWMLRIEDDLVSPARRRSRHALLALALALLSLRALLATERRERVAAVGPHRFYEDTPLSPVATPEFFAGILAPPVMRETLDRIGRLLAERGIHHRVFFAARLEFGYAAWQIEPSREVPLVWDFLREGDVATVSAVRRFESAHYAICFFLESLDRPGEPDFSSYPDSLRRLVEERYHGRLDGNVYVFERNEP